MLLTYSMFLGGRGFGGQVDGVLNCGWCGEGGQVNGVQGRKGGKQVLRMMSRDAVIASFKFCFPIFGFG